MADTRGRRMDDAPPLVREVYAEMLRDGCGGLQRLLSQPPQIMRDFLAFYGTVGQSLPRRLYELVYIRIAAVSQCHS